VDTKADSRGGVPVITERETMIPEGQNALWKPKVLLCYELVNLSIAMRDRTRHCGR